VPTAWTAGGKAGHCSACARLSRSGRGHRTGHALRVPQARRGPKPPGDGPTRRWLALCSRRARYRPWLRLRERSGGAVVPDRNDSPPFRQVRMIVPSGKRRGFFLSTLSMRWQRPVRAGSDRSGTTRAAFVCARIAAAERSPTRGPNRARRCQVPCGVALLIPATRRLTLLSCTSGTPAPSASVTGPSHACPRSSAAVRCCGTPRATCNGRVLRRPTIRHSPGPPARAARSACAVSRPRGRRIGRAGGFSPTTNGLRAACPSRKRVRPPACLRTGRMGCCGAGGRLQPLGRVRPICRRAIAQRLPRNAGHGRRDTHHPRAMPPRHRTPGTIGCHTPRKDAGGFPGRQGISAGRRPRMFLCFPYRARR
jgi:hypothetical protein